MATAAAIASMTSPATLVPLSSSIEMEGSATGVGAGVVAAGFGAMATFAGAGVGFKDAAGVAGVGSSGATGGLVGLPSASSSIEGFGLSVGLGSGVGSGVGSGRMAGLAASLAGSLAASLVSGFVLGVSAEFSFLGSVIMVGRLRRLCSLSR